MTNEEIIDKYITLGWKLLPIVRGTKEPPNGITFDTVNIENYRFKWDKYDVAVQTGSKSNIIVIDTDRVHTNWGKITQNTKEFCERLHNEHTKVLNTRSGNKSYFFKWSPTAVALINCRQDILNTRDLGYQVDVRGERGYNLIPFSAGYTWDVGAIKPLPEWLINILLLPAISDVNHSTDISTPEDGNRHNWFMTKAGAYLARGFTIDATTTHLHLINKGLDNPLAEDDLIGLINRIYKLDKRNHPDAQKDVMSVNEYFNVFGDSIFQTTVSKYPEFTTSFDYIDSKIWGFQRRKLNLISGHPSTGKSLVCQLSALRNAEQGKKVLFFTAEMPTKDAIIRLLIHLYGISSRHFLDGNFTIEEKHMIQKGKEYLSKLPLYFYDSLVGIKQIEDITKRDLPDIIYCDYFQDCVFENDGHFCAEEFVRRLHEVAKICNIPVVLASQLEEVWMYQWNNQTKQKERVKQEATCNDVRRTKALYQKADMIILLNSKDADEETEGDTLLKLRVGKNKINGERPVQYFKLNRNNLRYIPIERGVWYSDEQSNI